MTQNNPVTPHTELIDGAAYDLELPTRIHQEICFSLSRKIADFIDSSNSSGKVYPAPFAVFLGADNYVEPDISVICDKQKLTDQGCSGAPDWIIEVTSPTTQRMDYFVKLFKYRIAGVREYWIVNPMKQTVQVYSFVNNGDSKQFCFDDTINTSIYENLLIRIADFL
ncbi:MAG: Uma2 family endonuclease [Lachnospiraceae bacterium]|nr:Uma2 family endonuclease [Lachnospiraceae bacterium]